MCAYHYVFVWVMVFFFSLPATLWSYDKVLVLTHSGYIASSRRRSFKRLTRLFFFLFKSLACLETVQLMLAFTYIPVLLHLYVHPFF